MGNEPVFTGETTESEGSTEASKFANGSSCSHASQCDSGFCVDGYCCNAGCSGVCASCDVPGAEGTCSAPESDSTCVPASCPADTECLTYENAASGGNCEALNSCVTDADCPPHPVTAGTSCQSGTGECNGSGECVVPDKKALGEPCSLDTECGSGACSERIDGTQVCCDGACDGPCEACTEAGYCNAKPADDDACGVIDCPGDTSCADFAPDSITNRCATFGQCKTALAECTAEYSASGTSCGTDKICDGSGSCVACPSQTGSSRTCTTECPCDAGEGICSAHSQCDAGLVCIAEGGVKFGFDGNTCLPPHCDNNVQDTDETSVDCGGDCGCGAAFDVTNLRATFSGISDDGGKVVAFITGQNTRTAYLWEAANQYSVLSTTHTARGISGDGRVIIGESSSGPVRWVNGGQPESLLPQGQFTNTIVRAVSNDGAVIVGTGYPSGSSSPIGLVWSSGTVTNVSALGWFQDTAADGKLMIGFTNAGVFKLWSPASGASDAVLPGNASFASNSVPTMSANGRYVVGDSMLWDRTQGTVKTLPPLPDVNASPYGTAVTDSGMVVGMTCINCEGVYWSPVDGYEPHPFTELMASYGVEIPPGVMLGPVRLVSPDGKSFVGEAFYGDFGSWRLRIE